MKSKILKLFFLLRNNFNLKKKKIEGSSKYSQDLQYIIE